MLEMIVLMVEPLILYETPAIGPLGDGVEREHHKTMTISSAGLLRVLNC